MRCYSYSICAIFCVLVAADSSFACGGSTPSVVKIHIGVAFMGFKLCLQLCFVEMLLTNLSQNTITCFTISPVISVKYKKRSHNYQNEEN